MAKKTAKKTVGPKETKEPTFQPLTLSLTMPETVALLLTSKEPEVIFTACRSIHQYVGKSEVRARELVGYHTVPYASQLLRSANDDVITHGCFTLATVSKCKEGAEELLNQNVFPVFKSLLEAGHPSVEYVTFCLSRMGRFTRGKIEIYEAGLVPILCTSLNSKDPDIIKNTLETLALVFEDYEARFSVVDPELLLPFFPLTLSTYPIIQQLALTCIAYLAEVEQLHAKFRETDAINNLSKQLTAPDLNDLHALVAVVLNNLMTKEENIKVSVSLGLVQRLNNCLMATYATAEAKVLLAGLLGKMVVNEECRKLVLETDSDVLICGLLDSRADEIKAKAALATARMAEFSWVSRNKIAAAGAIPKLVNMLSSPSFELIIASLDALTQILKNNYANGEIFTSSGGMEPLVKALHLKEDNILMMGCDCMLQFVTYTNLREQCLQFNPIKPLVDGLDLDVPSIRAKICYVLGSFSADSVAREKMLQARAVPKVMGLLKTGSETVVRAILWLIQVMSTSSVLTQEVTKCGGILELTRMMKDQDDSIVRMTLNKLLDSHLSAKYTALGRLTVTDKIMPGFYDIKIASLEDFPSLLDLAKPGLVGEDPVYLINPKKEEFGDEVLSDSGTRSSLDKKSPTPSKGSKKKKSPGRVKNNSNSFSTNSPIGGIPDDFILGKYLDEVREQCRGLETKFELAKCIAIFVSSVMGGSFTPETVNSMSWLPPILKKMIENDSILFPLGCVELGFFHHRALLFKFLADNNSLPCTLVRNNWNRAYNEIYVQLKCRPEIQRYIVDLMFNPGSLYEVGTCEAQDYIKQKQFT